MRELIRKILKEEVKRTLNEQSSIQPSDFCFPLKTNQGYSAGPVDSLFGHRRKAGHRHAGIDYKADSGDMIRAPYGGEIEYAKIHRKGCGGTLIVHHGEGLRTKYCHVRHFSVKEGEIVVKGQQVGEVGGGYNDVGKGNALGNHLHYSIHPNTNKKTSVGKKRWLAHANGVDPEPDWIGNMDCSGADIIVIDDKEKEKEEKKYHDGEKQDCYGVLSTKEVRSDTLKLMKIYTNGFIINDNGDVVHETKFFPNSIENMDRGEVNAKGIELYAKHNGLTDDGDDISIANGNIWVDCRLNSVVFNHINDNDITYG